MPDRPIRPWPVYEVPGTDTTGIRILLRDGTFVEVTFQPPTGRMQHNGWLDIEFTQDKIPQRKSLPPIILQST